MPGRLLHAQALVQCAHTPPGIAEPNQTDRRVKVSGHYVVTRNVTYRITGCSMPPPSSGNGPCTSATWRTAATRVKASGRPVLLSDSQAICVPTGTGLKIVATQTRVTGT